MIISALPAVCNSDFRGKTFLVMFLENGGGSTANMEIVITNPGTFSSLVTFSVFAPYDTSLNEMGITLAELEVFATLI